MEYSSINLKEKLNRFSDYWSPKIIAQMNNYHFKLVKFQGDFVWHKHDDTDEVFIALEGEMSIEFRDGKIDLKAGEMFVVPKGIEHKPMAENECSVMLVEPSGTINTGNAGGRMTAENNTSHRDLNKTDKIRPSQNRKTRGAKTICLTLPG